jgi:hypothetical protein
MFAAGMDEAIGQQHKGAVTERRPLPGLAEQRIEDVPQPELLKQGADDEHGSPGGGFKDFEVGSRHFADQRRLASEQALQLRQQGGQEILAAEVGNDPLLDLAVLAVGLDDTDIDVDGAVGGGHFDGAEVHGI